MGDRDVSLVEVRGHGRGGVDTGTTSRWGVSESESCDTYN